MIKITLKNKLFKNSLGNIVKAGAVACMMLAYNGTSAQVTLINPNGDGGFETGTTLAANGWTAVNAPNGNRSWYIGTAQAGYTGARAAFIGNSNTQVGTAPGARTVHLYREITIPAGAENIQLSFKYKQNADYIEPDFYDYLEVYLSNAAPVNGQLPTGTSVYGPFPETNLTTFTQQSVTLANSIAGTTTNLIFTFVADNITPHTYGAIDDISLTYELPACQAPGSLSVVPQSDSATLSWIAPASPPSSGYQYTVTDSNTPPASGTPATGLTGNISPLLESHEYFAWVRSNCGNGQYSSWKMIPFRTPCTASDVPYILDFENAAVPGLPDCTLNENTGTGNDWITEVIDDAGFTGNSLIYEYHDDNPADVWFITNGVNLTGGTTYKISYKYGTAGFEEKMAVYYGMAGNAAAMTIQLADHPSILNEEAETHEEEFTPATTGVYYFGFHAYSDADQFLLMVDDITIDSSLSSGSFDSTQLSYFPNPVQNKLNISNSSDISSVRVYNMLGQQVLVKQVNAPQAAIDMSSVSAGHYIVKVSAGDYIKTVKVLKQ